VRRGDLVTVAAGRGYGGKPRPALVVQSDLFEELESVTVCLVTSRRIGAPDVRIPVEPDSTNGLATPSWIMIDRLLALPKEKVGRRTGRISATLMSEVTAALALFLGIATT
jgi:mRNA interferase MazF